MPLEDKVRLLTGADFWRLRPDTAAGLAAMLLSDGPTGVRGPVWDERASSLQLPNAACLAASWDPDLLWRAGQLLGLQAREKGVHVLLGPTVNVQRSPLGGRNFESYSEDPLLAARLAVGYVRGVQSTGVAATVKHFAGNESETDRMRYDAVIDEKTLREIYLYPFEAAVREAGAWAVMAAYNSVNGVPMTENRALLEDLLKREWGFDGVVISDWMATRSTEASALGGLDLVMPGPDGPWGDALVAAVRAGRVPAQVIDDKVDRLLLLAERVGALGTARPAPSARTPSDATDILREFATRGMVLLRNDGVLPLDRRALRRVALIGPNAAALCTQGGGSAQVHPAHVVSPASGLIAALGDQVRVDLYRGVDTQRLLPLITDEIGCDPDTGDPGVRVDYLTADGQSLGSEIRPSARVKLLPPGRGGSTPSRCHQVALRVRVRAGRAGTHEVSVAGVGQFLLRVGDQQESVRLVGEAFAALARPSEFRRSVDLAAGQTLEISVTHACDAVGFTAFRLGFAPPLPDEDEQLAAAVAGARDADVAIVVVGTSEEIETEGFDRGGLALAGRQDELVRRVAGANPRTVVVVNAGAPVLLPWAQKVGAVLWCWLPGQAGGAALADVLVGVAEPTGRLPVSIPADEHDCPVLSTTPVNGKLDYRRDPVPGYRGYAARGASPAFAFGHGLGYTQWRYEALVVSADGAGGLVVEVTLCNTGPRDGREVVQCYLEPDDQHEPRRLVGLGQVLAAAGQRQVVRIALARRVLCRYDVTQQAWSLPAGPHRVIIGRSAVDAQCIERVVL